MSHASAATWRHITATARQRRLDLRINHGQMAEALDVSRSTFSQWERGAGTPGLRAALAWLDYLGLDVHLAVREVEP